jgi:uncharacterized protein YqfB (UPF0267 family)
MGLAAFNRMRLLAAQGKKPVTITPESTSDYVPTTKTVVEMNWNEMRAEAKKRGIEGYGKMGKDDLIKALSESGE